MNTKHYRMIKNYNFDKTEKIDFYWQNNKICHVNKQDWQK